VLSGYGDNIRSKNPLMYESAKVLYDSLCEQSYSTPFETRRVLVKTFKVLDKLLVSNGIKALRLYEKMIVKFIPSGRQLKLKVSQVFRPHTNSLGELLLTAQSDGQLCFLHEDGIENCLIDKLKDMTVEEFLTWAYTDVIIRK